MATQEGDGLFSLNERWLVSVPITLRLRCSWTTRDGRAEGRTLVVPPKHYWADITDSERNTVRFVV